MRNRILQTASSLFYLHGIRTVTMDDVAKELKISKKTIYQHFEDKHEIVSDIIEREIWNSCCNSKVLKETSRDPVEEMVKSVSMIRDTFDVMKPSLLFDLQKYYPEVWSRMVRFQHGYHLDEIRRNLEEGVRLGLYRPDINVDVLACLRLKQVEFGLDPDAFPQDEACRVAVQEEFADLFMRGILTEEGFKLYHHYLKKQQVEK